MKSKKEKTIDVIDTLVDISVARRYMERTTKIVKGYEKTLLKTLGELSKKEEMISKWAGTLKGIVDKGFNDVNIIKKELIPSIIKYINEADKENNEKEKRIVSLEHQMKKLLKRK